MPKGGSGWTADKLDGGRTTLSRGADGKIDLSYTDITKGVYSSRAEGAEVMMTRQEPGEAAVIVVHPGKTIEVFDYIKLPSGEWHVLHLQSKGWPLSKNSVMRAPCSEVTLP